MSARDDGGPAFPSEGEGHGNPKYHSPGMTLREWYAGMAPNPAGEWMASQRAMDHSRNPYNYPDKPKLRSDIELIASYRFEFADAMLAERAKAGK